MGLFSKKESNIFKMITSDNSNYYVYDRKVYNSDIVRSCLRPYTKSIGKAVVKHIRETTDKRGQRRIAINPEPYLRFLLEEPNPYMTFQKMLEKMAFSLKLNGNAFAVIIRDQNDYPREIYPVPANGVESLWLPDGELALRFYLGNGQMPVFRYSDVVHLRGDFSNDDLFGDAILPALIPLMEVSHTIDRGLMAAIKNSGIIRWILKITQGIKDKDIKSYAEEFAKNYLNIEQQSNIGVAAIDSKADLKQVDPKDYVPNDGLISSVNRRVLRIFNTNEHIIESRPTEDEWNAYYESEIEPDIKQLAEELTRKLFTRKERGCGNKIVVEAYSLAHASFKTKLELMGMVDRGALTPNEWRANFNLAPVDGGDELIRRLDTAVVNQIKNLTSKITGKNPDNDAEIIKCINKLIEGR